MSDPLDFLNEEVQPPAMPPVGRPYDAFDKKPDYAFAGFKLPKKQEGFTVIEYMAGFLLSFPVGWILFWLLALPIAGFLGPIPLIGGLAMLILFIAALSFPFVVLAIMMLYGKRRL